MSTTYIHCSFILRFCMSWIWAANTWALLGSVMLSWLGFGWSGMASARITRSLSFYSLGLLTWHLGRAPRERLLSGTGTLSLLSHSVDQNKSQTQLRMKRWGNRFHSAWWEKLCKVMSLRDINTERSRELWSVLQSATGLWGERRGNSNILLSQTRSSQLFKI